MTFRIYSPVIMLILYVREDVGYAGPDVNRYSDVRVWLRIYSSIETVTK